MSHLFTEQLTQALAVLAMIPSASQANGTNYTAYSTPGAGIDMSRVHRIITYLNVGAIPGSGNVQLYYIASANSNMAGNSNVATSIPLTGNTNNRVESLEMRSDQMPAGTRYAAPVLVINSGPVPCDLITLGADGIYKPESQFNTVNVLDQAVVT